MSDEKEIANYIYENIKTVNGKAIATDEAITNLYENGLISKGLAKWLKKVKYNESTGEYINPSGGSGSGGSGVTINMTVNPTPDMDVKELTAEISRRLSFNLRRGAAI
jgi:hypothetical protein